MLAWSRALQASASVSAGFDIKVLSCHLELHGLLYSPFLNSSRALTCNLKKKKGSMKGFNVTPEEGSASSDGPVGAVMWVGHGGGVVSFLVNVLLTNCKMTGRKA